MRIASVVPDLQAFGQLADRNLLALREALDGQQCLVLLRGQSHLAGGGLAETQEPPQRIAELGQDLVFGFGCDLPMGHGALRRSDTGII